MINAVLLVWRLPARGGCYLSVSLQTALKRMRLHVVRLHLQCFSGGDVLAACEDLVDVVAFCNAEGLPGVCLLARALSHVATCA